MGNQQGRPSEKKIEDMNSLELFKKVNLESQRLFNIYKNQFLNKEFCERLAIVYTNEMMNIPIEKIKDLHGKITDMKDNRGISAMIRYKSKLSDKEKFLSNEMKGKLEDVFINSNLAKSVKPKVKDIEVDFPEMQYIKPFVRNYLYGKKMYIHKGGYQNNNINELNKLISEINNGLNTRSNKIDRTNKRNNRGNNNKENNIRGSIRNNKGNNNRGSNVSKLSELPKLTTPNNNIKVNEIPEPREEKAETLVIRNLENEFKPQPENRNNKKSEKKVSNIPEKEDITNNNYCNNETEDCYLTKMEMCKTIIKHMTIRNHLIAAILSVIPMDDNGEKSFVSQKIKSLQKGMFCLPPKDKINPENSLEERVKIINKYSKFKSITKDECEKNFGGVFKELTEEQFSELKNDNDEISKGYKKYFSEMNSYYQNVTKKFLQILENLEKLKINNQDLMKLVYLTKELIDNLYAKTQEYYIMAVMLLMEKNLSKTKEKIAKKEERVTAILT